MYTLKVPQIVGDEVRIPSGIDKLTALICIYGDIENFEQGYDFPSNCIENIE